MGRREGFDDGRGGGGLEAGKEQEGKGEEEEEHEEDEDDVEEGELLYVSIEEGAGEDTKGRREDGGMEEGEGLERVSSSRWDNKHIGSRHSRAALPAICQAGPETRSSALTFLYTFAKSLPPRR